MIHFTAATLQVYGTNSYCDLSVAWSRSNYYFYRNLGSNPILISSLCFFGGRGAKIIALRLIDKYLCRKPAKQFD